VEAGTATKEKTATAQSSDRYFYGVGRRKSSVARVRLFPGQGNIVVNNRSLQDYFGARGIYQTIISEPLRLMNLVDRFDMQIRVTGGGLSGQAEAIRHAIARALTEFDSELRPALKQAGLLTRDARVKERKKVGLKRARKAPQYTKR
jgi:small subunit ribosomal protein S9